MARKTQNAKLKLVEQHNEEEAKRRKQEEGWKLTPGEVAGRVRDIRQYLEEFASQLAGLQFDIVSAVSHPPSIDYDELPHPDQLAERLDPFIKRYYERLYAKIPESGAADADNLANMKWHLAETAFAIGALAGPIFNGTASKQEIDRLERGLVHATVPRDWQVKS